MRKYNECCWAPGQCRGGAGGRKRRVWVCSRRNHRGLSTGLLKTWQLAFPGAKDPRERETKTEATESLTTSSEVTYHHSCLILLVTPINPIQCGRGLQKGMNTRNLGAHGGLSGRLATSVPRRSQRRQYCFLLTQPPSSNPH